MKKVSEIRGDYLPKGTSDESHSTNWYWMYANTFEQGPKVEHEWEKVLGLDKQYMRTFRNIEAYQERRNQVAHETEFQFARLLLSDR